MARPPKPTALLCVEGGLRGDRHSGAEPVPDGAPVKPRGLPKHAGKLWDFIVPQLVDLGIATKLDQPLLEEMVRWFASYRSWSDKAVDSGKPTDLFAAKAAWKTFDSIAARFGLSPVDRVKLRGAVPLREEDDATERFFRDRRRVDPVEKHLA